MFWLTNCVFDITRSLCTNAWVQLFLSVLYVFVFISTTVEFRHRPQSIGCSDSGHLLRLAFPTQFFSGLIGIMFFWRFLYNIVRPILTRVSGDPAKTDLELLNWLVWCFAWMSGRITDWIIGACIAGFLGSRADVLGPSSRLVL